ncbi:MAG: VCBS repeat-containing protein [Verrucomicrobia bacterium]|nr:VCBS repeat-containing protein [Verrucomicrobiota bacterium]
MSFSNSRCALAVLFLTVPLLFQTSARALEWKTGDGFRSAELPVPKSGKTGFTLLPPTQTGITFANDLPDERSITNRNLLSGSGVAAGDIDGDGWCDLYFCHLGGPNVLYRNLGGWKFEDVTAAAGVACAGQDSTGATFADVDGDGDLDLLVNSFGGGTRLFLNDGKGHFQEATMAAGLSSRTGSTSLALADIDGDGDLDLYVANFRPTTIKDNPRTKFRIQMVNDRPVVALVDGVPTTTPELTNRFVMTPSGVILEYGEPDVLYLNDGKGHFTPVSFTGGSFLDEDGHPLRGAPHDWGLAVQFHDLNGDGAPDIYVCNDLFTPDRIWINDGKGKFRALSRVALRNTSTFSMGVDFGDLDRDGNVDFFVVDMLSREHSKRHTQMSESRPATWPPGVFENRPQLVRNTLQIGRGDGTFAEIAYFAGVEASDWSWGPIFLDVDLDGYEDILVSNGQLRDFQNADMGARIEAAKSAKEVTQADISKLMKAFPPLASPKLIFRNRGNLTFEEVGAAWGFNTVGIGQGMALADLDNDGDLDVIINNLNAPAGVYRNDGVKPRVAVRLKGLPPNRQGIGAKIKVLGGPVTQTQEMICGGRYMSGDDPMRVFAAGSLTNDLTIEVIWRNGKKSVVSHAAPNRIYEIAETGATENPTSAPPTPKPIFQDVSDLIKHVHHEEQFDDFERQPLLPNRLGQLGPGVSWFDVDGDGWDDLIIGSGRGGQLAVFQNNGHGGFTPLADAMFATPVARDQTTVLGWTPSPGATALLAGSANYEDGFTNGSVARIYDLKNKVTDDSLPGQLSSTGPLALADVDGDGDLDLFVGGRVVPGRYPEAAASLLFRNESGKLQLDGQNNLLFAKVGLVSGAVFSDLDGDGFPELILACEWGPVRVFKNDHGKFTETTEQLGLAKFNGWWNGVTTGDIDGDGRLDIIASNWGLNSKYRPTPQHPDHLYFGDYDGNTSVDLIESHFDETMQKEVPERGLRAISTTLPFVREKVATYEAYGLAGVMEIFGDNLKNGGALEASTLASMVFFNRGDHFEAAPLPREAQWAPAFGVCVGDMDGDGNEDIFLSQNFFATTPESSRNDAGRGLWLRGDGKRGLSPVAGQDSGIKVYGEQRGCALSDFDGDGRVDLVVTQNGAATKLFRNVTAKPGLRVRLAGPPGNPTGVGASVRLMFGKKFGPTREVHAGSGYWSQDSAVQVLGTPEAATQVWVRWPGGKTLTTNLQPNAREIAVDETGKLKVVK